MDQGAIKEIADQLGVGADYLAGHLAGFAPQWGMFKAIQDLAGALLTGLILAVLVLLARRAMGREGDDGTLAAAALGISALVTLVVFWRFASDAIAHLAVPQAAMVGDMLEMVRNG